jgi:hypothetical protein
MGKRRNFHHGGTETGRRANPRRIVLARKSSGADSSVPHGRAAKILAAIRFGPSEQHVAVEAESVTAIHFCSRGSGELQRPHSHGLTE